MDRLIASNTVAVGSGDTAPATGTPGQATSGNPATNTPATDFPAYAFNAMQEELIAVIVGAGLTPARNTWNQLLTAIQTIIQSGVSNVCTDTGAANAYVTTLTPAPSAPVAGSPFWMKVKTTNTGASTLNATGTAYPLVGGAHAALQGNELVANGWALIDWNATLSSYVLFECTGASVQIAPATQSNHAVQLGQVQGTYGSRNLVGANNATNPNTQFTVTADQVVVRNPTTGLLVNVAGANVTADITVAGPAAGGRDQSAAFAASSWIHMYWIYNPTTTTLSAIFSANAPSTGPTLPGGYTSWSYITALRLNSSTQIVAGYLRGDYFGYQAQQNSLTNGSATSLTAVSVATLVPSNALDFLLSIPVYGITSTGSGQYGMQTIIEVAGTQIFYQQGFGGGATANAQMSTSGGATRVPNVAQQYYYANISLTGTAQSVTHAVQGYRISNGAT